MQKTLDRTDWHIQHCGNLHRAEIFLIAEQNDHSGIGRQVLDQLSQPLTQQRVGVAALGQRLGYGLESDTGAQPPLAGFVDAAMGDCAPEPPRCMRGAFDLPKLFIKLKEYLLSQLFGAFPIAQEPECEAEDERLVIGYDFPEIEFDSHIAITDERAGRLQGSVIWRCAREVMRENFSRTALRVAMRRAAHQILDSPLVLEDAYAFRILPPESAAEVRAAAAGGEHHFAKAMRAFMAVRSRFAEDEFARAVGAGVRQYVALGAGLDTFAWRNPHRDSGVRVFEVDHPATQAWKLGLIEQGNLPEPPATVYVPLDFERQSLPAQLSAAGFDAGSPAFFSWLGVVPYLTLEAFRGTLRFFGSMAAGSGAVFDYPLPRQALGESERRLLDQLSARVANIGEPFQLFFTPPQLTGEVTSVGWRVLDDLGGAEIGSRYFPGRDTIRGGLGRLMSAGN